MTDVEVKSVEPNGEELLRAIRIVKDLVAHATARKEPMVLVNTRQLAVLLAGASLWADPGDSVRRHS